MAGTCNGGACTCNLPTRESSDGREFRGPAFLRWPAGGAGAAGVVDPNRTASGRGGVGAGSAPEAFCRPSAAAVRHGSRRPHGPRLRTRSLS